MKKSDAPGPKRTDGKGHGEKTILKRLLVAVGAVLVLLMALPPVVLRLLAPTGRAQVSHPDTPPLDWEADFGSGQPWAGTPERVELPPVQNVHILPEVLSVRDAVEWKDGWILLDRRSGKIHFLDPGRGVVNSWGRRGEGPGELERPVALELQDSLLWVLNQSGFSLDRFSVHSGFRARRRIRGGGCAVGLAKGLAAGPHGMLLLLKVCPALTPGPGTALVERVDTTGWTTPLLELPLGRPGSRRIDPFRSPLFASWPGGFVLGTGDAPCLKSFTSDGTASGKVCLPDYPRVRVPEDPRGRLETRLRGIVRFGLLPVRIPDHMPWFDHLFRVHRGLVVRRIRGERERDLILLTEGGRVFRMDTSLDEGTFVGDRSLIQVRDLMEGTEIRIFPTPWADTVPER
jgi:hypothetical protein